jgi:hypothetical protein
VDCHCLRRIRRAADGVDPGEPEMTANDRMDNDLLGLLVSALGGNDPSGIRSAVRCRAGKISRFPQGQEPC